MPLPRPGNLKPAGQIRQSQVVTTFGPGAMMDLPDYAVILGGLDHWTGYEGRPIAEERLAAKVGALLNRDSVRFYAPPPDPDDPTAAITGITAWLFPEWFVAQVEKREGGVRARPLVYRSDLEKGMTYRLDREKPVKVVPIRFVQACPRGHVSDINWKLFVHGKDDPCPRPLWLEERGTSGDLTDVFIRCECGKTRALFEATLKNAPLGFCNGRRPWLGSNATERCGGAVGPVPNRFLIRAASNAYFAQTLSVISIPEADATVRTAVDEVWDLFLQYSESLDDIGRERRKQRVSAALEGLSNDDVWQEVQRRKGGLAPTTVGIREAEIKTLLSSPDTVGTDQPDGLFYARTIPTPTGEPALTGNLSRVVKVHRLREVIAQIGFTRFEAAVPDVNGELALDVERAELSQNQDWLPAIENRGEGVFIGLKAEAVKAWLARDAVKRRSAQLLDGFLAWQKINEATSAKFPGPAFIMLHSLSHMLITAVALDCGYAASSIRERIYASDAGYGILLYTATADAEGTLGGLVEAADRIDRYLRQAVEIGELCSNDPVCAQHRPDNRQEDRFPVDAVPLPRWLRLQALVHVERVLRPRPRCVLPGHSKRARARHGPDRLTGVLRNGAGDTVGGSPGAGGRGHSRGRRGQGTPPQCPSVGRVGRAALCGAADRG